MVHKALLDQAVVVAVEVADQVRLDHQALTVTMARPVKPDRKGCLVRKAFRA